MLGEGRLVPRVCSSSSRNLRPGELRGKLRRGCHAVQTVATRTNRWPLRNRIYGYTEYTIYNCQPPVFGQIPPPERPPLFHPRNARVKIRLEGVNTGNSATWAKRKQVLLALDVSRDRNTPGSSVERDTCSRVRTRDLLAHMRTLADIGPRVLSPVLSTICPGPLTTDLRTIRREILCPPPPRGKSINGAPTVPGLRMEFMYQAADAHVYNYTHGTRRRPTDRARERRLSFWPA